jgi:acetyl-CoA acetyltransferase
MAEKALHYTEGNPEAKKLLRTAALWQNLGSHRKRREDNVMSINGKAYIVEAFEHPTRKAPDKSVAQLHAECAKGALDDAGLKKDDIDGYFCSGDAPGTGGLNMANYMGLKLSHIDSTDTGGSSYLVHVNHAAQAIALGKCNIALITLSGRPRSEGSSGTIVRSRGTGVPDEPSERGRPDSVMSAILHLPIAIACAA